MSFRALVVLLGVAFFSGCGRPKSIAERYDAQRAVEDGYQQKLSKRLYDHDYDIDFEVPAEMPDINRPVRYTRSDLEANFIWTVGGALYESRAGLHVVANHPKTSLSTTELIEKLLREWKRAEGCYPNHFYQAGMKHIKAIDTLNANRSRRLAADRKINSDGYLWTISVSDAGTPSAEAKITWRKQLK